MSRIVSTRDRDEGIPFHFSAYPYLSIHQELIVSWVSVQLWAATKEYGMKIRRRASHARALGGAAWLGHGRLGPIETRHIYYLVQHTPLFVIGVHQ